MTFLKIEVDTEISELYPGNVFHYKNEQPWKINVFFFLADSNYIQDNWLKFSSSISAIYQSSLTSRKDEFERWNFYIIYLSVNKVSKDIKNKIENDKFSSRKIIEDNFTDEVNCDIANNLIIKHITNSDLVEIVEKTKENYFKEYVPLDLNLWVELPQESILGDKKQQQSIVDKLKSLLNEN